MIAWLAALAMRAGIPERFARAAVVAIGVVLLILAAGIAKCCYDRTLIASHDAARDLELSEGARAADANAAETRRADDARLSAETYQLNEVVTHAEPAPLSDARRNYYSCLRVQQAARAAGRPAPAC